MEELTTFIEEFEKARDVADRINLVCKIGSSGVPGTAKVLVETFAREGDVVVREAIVGSLLSCDTEEVMQEVVPLLKSEDASQRSMAFDVLTYKADEKALGIFEGLLHDADRDVRVMTVHALGRSRCPGVLSLLRKVAAEDEDINVVGAAVEYIGEIGERGDVELVQQCKERFDHPYLDFIVARALIRLGGEPGKIAS
ncbi:HEAT repeat domain-containing protein [Neomoorella humiferrea]|uniref:HEAT repeat protein n=1 Tax=Neomoorella humiferrea TaxID=676965 RepID=A0A2T0AQR5_9FIRM|nr:HEAT repeat domain-containing protein [Moorella humiferrea]PRR71648.1 HEAT repeat protein [Moorella humiferrea]